MGKIKTFVEDSTATVKDRGTEFIYDHPGIIATAGLIGYCALIGGIMYLGYRINVSAVKNGLIEAGLATK